MENFISFDTLMLMFLISVVVVALTVMLDYYLRAGVKNGRLFRRIGLVAAIEAIVYALAMAIQAYV